MGDANGGYQRRIPGAKGGAWQKNVRMTDLIDTGPACCVAQGVVEDGNEVFCAQGCKDARGSAGLAQNGEAGSRNKNL